MDNREKIISALEDGPLSFSDLKRRTGLENGVIQHHVEASDRIRKERGALMLEDSCVECDMNKVCDSECIHKILENDRKKQVIELKAEGLQQSEIAEELDLTRATVNYHVSDLKDKGLIEDGEVAEAVKKEL